MRRGIFFSGLVLVLLFSWNLFNPSLARASDWFADLLPSQDPKETVSELKFLDSRVPVEIVPRGADFESHVEIRFQFNKADWSLIRENEQIQPQAGEIGVYTVSARLLSEVTPLEIVAVGPLGEVEMQKVLVRLSEWKVFKEEGAKAPPKRTYVFSSLGFSNLSYEETGLASFSALSSVFKVSYQYLLTPPQWEFGTNAFFNVFPIHMSGMDQPVRFLGVNLRFGYIFPFVKDPSRLSFLIGTYYTRMFGTNDQFGYKTLIYPQFYPTFRKKMRNGDAFYVYLKYVPLVSGIGLSFTEREFAIGGGWEHPIREGHPFSLSVDASDLRLNVTSDHRIITQSFSINLGYGW